VSVKRLFRCNDCGWRGWLLPLEFAAALDSSEAPDLAPDLASLDTALQPGTKVSALVPRDATGH